MGAYCKAIINICSFGSSLKTIGVFEAAIILIIVFLFPPEVITVERIIGMNLLKDANVKISSKDVFIEKRE